MNDPERMRTKDFYEEYWSPSAGDGGSPQGAFSPELRSLIRGVLRPEDRLLDAGCGDGAKYGTWVATLVGEYLGVDIAEQAVAAARSRGLEAQAVPDLTDLGLPDASFDACVTIEVLEHLMFPEAAVAEIRRVLRPGGRVIATVPNVAYWRYRMDLALLGRWHPQGHGDGPIRPYRDPHLRFFTVKALRRLFAEGGFDVQTVTGVNASLFGDLPFVQRRFGTERISRPFAGLQRVLPGLFGSTIALVARRP